MKIHPLELKIESISEEKYYIVETSDGDYRRSYAFPHWEKAYGSSWEEVFDTDYLESLFQEFSRQSS